MVVSELLKQTQSVVMIFFVKSIINYVFIMSLLFL